MTKFRSAVILAFILPVLMLAGCSTRDTVLPTPPPQTASSNFVTYDGAEFPPADDSRLILPTASPVPLPKSKLVKEVAALAIDAVYNETYWPLKTFCIFDNEELYGFQVAILVDNYIDCDGRGYDCYYYMDREIEPATDPIFTAAPDTMAISDSRARVLKALRDPDTIINEEYKTDVYFYYMYTFDYPYGEGYRRFGMCKFKLCDTTAPPDDPF